jgi:hypothetical protein
MWHCMSRKLVTDSCLRAPLLLALLIFLPDRIRATVRRMVHGEDPASRAIAKAFMRGPHRSNPKLFDRGINAPVKGASDTSLSKPKKVGDPLGDAAA